MIQFECPHCGAVLRVPDQAMGQRGKCPHCSRSLLVPHPPGHPAAANAPATPAGSELHRSGVGQPPPVPPTTSAVTTAATTAPATVSPAAGELGDLFSAITQQKTSGRQTDPLLEITRRNRQQNFASLVTGLVFLSLILALGAGLYWYLQPQISGQVFAEKVTTEALRSRTLSPQAMGAADEFARYLKQQRDRRVQINSQLLRSSLEGIDRGLLLEINPTVQTDLYRVDLLGQQQPLRQFYAEHFKAFQQTRDQELQRAAKEFFAHMEASPEALLKDPELLMQFRDRLVLPGLVDGLGYRLAAFVGATPYPCLGQDRQERLLFAVPAGTTDFEIREREIAGLPRLFPASMKFQVRTRPLESSPSAAPEFPPASGAPGLTIPDPPESAPSDADADAEKSMDSAMEEEPVMHLD